MLSLFPMSGYVYMYVRNIGVVSVPCEWSCIFASGISMVSLFLVVWSCIYVSGIQMLSLFLVSGHVYRCVRNFDVVSVPCEWSCIYVSGISILSLFLVSGHVYVCQEYRCCLFLVSGHVHVCQEDRCCLCSL
jgi:hypothetical protein